MQLIVIRHGRPERVENNNGDSADPNLTEVGHEQAQRLAEWLSAEPIDAIYVSSMRRARQTAAPLETVTGLAATVDDRIREYDDGENHYLPLDELKNDPVAYRAFIKEHTERDLASFQSRVLEVVDEIVNEHAGQSVAMVCHGGVINAIAASVLGIGSSMFFNPNYTSINRIMASRSGVRSIGSLNDIGHLHAHSHLVLY